jgi:plastocyanin
MRRRWIAGGVIAVGSITAGAALAERVAGASATVEITDFRFTPSEMLVDPGDSITFVNNGSATHHVVASDGSFTSGMLSPGDAYTFPIGDTSVSYACALHANMTGNFAVQGSGLGSSTSAGSTTTSATTVAGATSTTSATLAVTGTGTNILMAIAVMLVGAGALLLVASRRRATFVPATVCDDAILPRRGRDRDRRDLAPRPPADL